MYLNWNEQTITDFSNENINRMYNDGYVFTRRGKGVMQQTRSVRIDLSKFELSSENRRIIRKVEGLELNILPLPYSSYTWQVGKLAKDFYDEKFGVGTMSANKVKEMLTEENKSNFNVLFSYVISNPKGEKSFREQNAQTERSLVESNDSPRDDNKIGYTICYANEKILHYSYPFYKLNSPPYEGGAGGGLPPNLGMGMMTMAVSAAKENGLQYVYLGSFQRPTDTYKLQFSGLEWFDGERWSENLEELKKTV